MKWIVSTSKQKKARQLLSLINKTNNQDMKRMPITKRIPSMNGGSAC
jgi:hypothetical protein